MVVGYEYTSIIGNMGSLLAVLAIAPLFVILLKVLQALVPCVIVNKSNCFRKILSEQISNALNGLFWNGVINYIDQSYLILLTMSLINVTDLRLGTNYSTIENVSSTLSLLFISVAVTFPVVIVWFYNKRLREMSLCPI